MIEGVVETPKGFVSQVKIPVAEQAKRLGVPVDHYRRIIATLAADKPLCDELTSRVQWTLTHGRALEDFEPATPKRKYLKQMAVEVIEGEEG